MTINFIELDGNTCLNCGSTEPLTLDHIIPRSRGGSNALDNLQTLCRPCNEKKGNATIDFRYRRNPLGKTFAQNDE